MYEDEFIKLNLHLRKVICFYTYSDYQQERTKAKKLKIDKWRSSSETQGPDGTPIQKGQGCLSEILKGVPKRYQHPILYLRLR